MRNIAHTPIHLVSCISSFLRISVFILSLCLIPNLLCLSSCVVSCILRHTSYPCIHPVFLFYSLLSVSFCCMLTITHTIYMHIYSLCFFSANISAIVCNYPCLLSCKTFFKFFFLLYVVDSHCVILSLKNIFKLFLVDVLFVYIHDVSLWCQSKTIKQKLTIISMNKFKIYDYVSFTDDYTHQFDVFQVEAINTDGTLVLHEIEGNFAPSLFTLVHNF